MVINIIPGSKEAFKFLLGYSTLPPKAKPQEMEIMLMINTNIKKYKVLALPME